MRRLAKPIFSIATLQLIFLVASAPAFSQLSLGNDWFLSQTEHRESPYLGTPAWQNSFIAADGLPVTVKVGLPQRPAKVLVVPALAPGLDARPHFQSYIYKAYNEGYSEVVFPAQRYVFKTAGSVGHVEINNISDLRVRGDGSTLIFTQAKSGVSLINSRRVIVRGFRIDYEELKIASAGWLRYDPILKKNYLEIDARYPVDAQTPLAVVTHFDTTQKKWLKNSRFEFFVDGTPVKYTYSGGQRFDSPVFNNFKFSANEVQELPVLVRHLRYSGNAVRVAGANSSDITLDWIIIHSAPGMGFYVSGIERGLRIVSSTIRTRTEDPLRLISTATDGIHIKNLEGDISIEGNTIRHQGDDGINIEGSLAAPTAVLVEPELGHTSITVPKDLPPLAIGDDIGFFDNHFEYLGRLKIMSLVHQGSVSHVVLDSSLRADMPAKIFVKNLSRSSGRVMISKNIFSDNRARGVVLQVPNTYINGNTISRTTMSGLILSSFIRNWLEGAGTSNSVINNNTISDVGNNVKELQEGAVSIVARTASGASTFPLHQHILFMNNRILLTGGAPCFSERSAFEVVYLSNTCSP